MKTPLHFSAAPACLARALPPHLVRRACLWAALGLLAAPPFGPPPAQAAVTEAWVHRYNNVVSNSYDQAFKVVCDAAGDIIVTGTTDENTSGGDILTIKYSGAGGSVLWQQCYSGPENLYDYPTALAVDGSGNVVVTGISGASFEFASGGDYYTAKYAAADGALLWEKHYNGAANLWDDASAVAVDGSGNVVVTGASYNGSSGDYYTAKYAAADGALLWEKRYNGPANSDDRANAVALDASGNVVVTGYSSGTKSYYDYYTAKYAATDGALLWEKRFNGSANSDDRARAVAVDSSGNVVITGSSASTGVSHFDTDYYTAKYAAVDGALLWEKRYNGPANSSDSPSAIAVDASGNVVVTGSSANGSAGSYNYYTVKYAAADGALLWEQRGPGPGEGGFNAALALDGNGNVLVTGSSIASGSGVDYYTVKYAAANGAILWEKCCSGQANGNDFAQAVAMDGSDNVVVTGFSRDGSNWGGYANSDYYTVKYAEKDGALLWEKRYNGPRNDIDSATAVAVDASGNIVVTGSSNNGNGTGDYYTAKYAAANGALLWEKRYNGPADSDDRANAMAVDSSGNVVVTGYSDNGQSFDYYTVKYAAADGALLWEKHYDGPANRDDKANAMAVDGSGNVVVTGSSSNGTNDDFYTAKYAAYNGALLWERRYNGPADNFEKARAVALDVSGNVVVTGCSDGTNFSADYYTAKYAATDGTLLWEKRYNGPADDNDEARAVTVDGGGNVVVTGASVGTGVGSIDRDYYTAKYAAANGALLWEKRYNGPGNYDDVASAVAVDGNGNVVVTGSSANSNGNFDYYTAKYAAADGTLLWEKRYNRLPNYFDRYPAASLAVDGSGNVVVTGYSNNGAPNYDDDYYTAKYAAADGALLWEIRFNSGAATSLALGPNGMVAVTGSSSGDYATVVYRENLPPVSIALVPIGIRLRFTGIPGRSYTIERASAVTGPWTPINTQTAPVSGLLEYNDAPAPSGQSFYRTVQP